MSDITIVGLSVADTGNYYTSTQVEGMLQEVGLALTTGGYAMSLKMGNVLVVDASNGNDATGAVNGKPFLTIGGALAYLVGNALTGVTVWVLPGAYTLSAGITVPDNCSIRGLSLQTCKVSLFVTASATLLTMGENTRVEDLNLSLTSTTATADLIGVALPGTTSVTSKIRTSVITVNNSGVLVGSTTNVYGVYCSGTGTLGPGTFSFNCLKGSTLNVQSNGGGNKYGLYMPSSSASQISTRDLNIYVSAPPNSASTGLYVGIYADNASSQVQVRTTSIAGSPYPATQLKLPVVLRTDANLASLSGTPTIQSVTLRVNDRVLVSAQTTATDNGIYIVASGAWTRALDMGAGSPALGVYTFVDLGTYTHTGWACTSNVNVGAGGLTFVQRYAGSDILQNAPQAANGGNGIQIGAGTDLVTRTAGAHPFTTYVTPTTIVYGLQGAVAGSTRYLWPGMQTLADSTQVFYRVQQQTVLQGLFVNCRTAPGVGNSFTITILKSTTGTVGSGVPTTMTATVVGATTSATNYLTSVDFEQGDYLSVQILSGSPGTATDVMVEIDLF